MKRVGIAIIVLFVIGFAISRIELSAKIGPQPPEYVGTWVTNKNGQWWFLELKENGRFKAVPSSPEYGDNIVGDWAVKDGKMLWMYSSVPSPLKAALSGPDEANVILKKEQNSFELLESNYTKSRFDRKLKS